LRRALAVSVVFLMILGLLAGCTPAPEGESGDTAPDEPAPTEEIVFRWAVTDGPTSLDPAKLYGNRSIRIAQNLFDGLTDVDENMKVVPCIAEDWEVSEDGLTYTFHLRDDVYFSNGDQVTAHDFKYSWNRALRPETGNPHLFMMSLMKGAQAVIDGEDEEAEGIVVKDDFTLEVTLESPAAYFLSLSTRWPYWVVHEETIETHGDDWTLPENFVSTGAFLPVEIELEQKYVLEANDDYFRGRPEVDRAEIYIINDASMRMMKYEAGELDAIANMTVADIRRIKESPDLKEEMHVQPGMRTTWLAMNAQKPPFDNVTLRKAFQYAIDKEELIEVALDGMGTPAHGFLPPGMPAYEADYQPYEFDPEKGRQLLEDAGYPGGEGLPDLSIVYSANEQNQKIFEFVQAQLAENLGIEIELEALPDNAFLEVRNDPEQRPYFFRNGMGADYPDPQEFLEYFGLSETFHNFEGHRDARFDELVLAANANSDQEERIEQYQEAHHIYMENSVMVPLVHPVTVYLVKPGFDGFGYNALYAEPLRKITVAK